MTVYCLKIEMGNKLLRSLLFDFMKVSNDDEKLFHNIGKVIHGLGYL